MEKRPRYENYPYSKILEKIKEFEIADDTKFEWTVAPGEITANWVLRYGGWPYLPLKSMPVDMSEFIEICLKSQSEILNTPAEGEGWKTLGLLGNWRYPVFETNEYLARITSVVPPEWKPFVTPKAMKILESLPFERIMACQILALEAGGRVIPHRDHAEPGLSRLIIPITHYDECLFRVVGRENLPFEVGVPMLFDPSYAHYSFNDQSNTRYHLHIRGVVGNRAQEFNEHVVRSAIIQNEIIRGSK